MTWTRSVPPEAAEEPLNRPPFTPTGPSNADRVDEPDLPEPPLTGSADTPASGFESGLSLPLLEGLVDELAIDQREGGGNVVRMTLLQDVDDEDEEGAG